MLGLLTLLSVSLSVLGTVVVRRRKGGAGDGSNRKKKVYEVPGQGGTQIKRHVGLASCIMVLLVLCGGMLLLGFQLQRQSKSNSSDAFKCSGLSHDERLQFLGEAQGVAHPIYTRNPKVQQHFNQGLLFRWGFNSVEALKSFKIAHELDPTCSMCIWGQAYSRLYHPNYVPGVGGAGYPVFNEKESQAVREIALLAHEVARKNLELSPENAVIQKEMQYAEALLLSFPQDEWTEQKALESALRSAARWLSLWSLRPHDVDAGVLAAEIIMIFNSWDYFDPGEETTNHETALQTTWSQILKQATIIAHLEQKVNETVADIDGDSLNNLLSQIPVDESIKGWRMGYPYVRLGPRIAEEILMRVLTQQPSHPFANHLHIHITEAGPLGKERNGVHQGLISADNLYRLGSLEGHLLHMPSHTFIRVGKYKEAVESNVRAYNLGLKQGRVCICSYAPEHNLEVLMSSASLGGMYEIAEKYAFLMQEVPRIMPGPYRPSGYQYTGVLFVWLQFGKWSAIQNYAPPTIGARGASRKSGQEFSLILWTYGQILVDLHSSRLQPPDQGRELSVGQSSGMLMKRLDELEKMIAAMPDIPQTRPGSSVGIYAAPYREIGEILILMARSCLSIQQNNLISARNALEKAVILEVKLGYMEPRRFHQPTRQCLGWFHYTAGNLTRAMEVFEEDLLDSALTPWSLFGLAKTSQQLHGSESSIAKDYWELYSQAIEGTNLTLHSSCPMLFD